MNWIQLGGSFAAVLMLAGVAWALRLGGAALDGPEDARRIAEATLSGFEPREAWVSADGDVALVLGGNAVALVRRHGARFVARRGAVVAYDPERRSVTIDTGERALAVVAIDGDADPALTDRLCGLGELADTDVS